MVSTFLASPTITEITVEDPNEAFDDLRDYCDYIRLTSQKAFAPIHLNTSLDAKLTAKRIGVRVPTSKLLDVPLLETIRIREKIAPRQFARLVEMYLFSKIAPHVRQAGTARLTQRARATNPDDLAFFYWRLLVKQRVYKKNKDVLIQLDRSERAEKVEQTVGDVAGDYERLLREMGKFGGNGEGAEGSGTGSGAGSRARAKRKNVVDDDEEDEDDADGDRLMADGQPNAKRARSEAL